MEKTLEEMFSVICDYMFNEGHKKLYLIDDELELLTLNELNEKKYDVLIEIDDLDDIKKYNIEKDLKILYKMQFVC